MRKLNGDGDIPHPTDAFSSLFHQGGTHDARFPKPRQWLPLRPVQSFTMGRARL